MDVGLIVAGKYRLRKPIGEGAMGSVWSATHEALDRKVAIKFLIPSQEDKEVASARFVREAKSAARVKHRFVVDVFDFGLTDDGLYYMVQELLNGQELAAVIQHDEPWRAREAIQFVMQCLSGLDAVHKAGLVHRDLKPQNVFVVRDNDGRFPKLLDFGISKTAETAAPDGPSAPSPVPGARRPPRLKQLTKVGVTLGTPCYMAPEQLRGSRDLDARADLYSVGVILYQWLTGHLPYCHDSLAELALQVSQRSAPTLAELRPELGQKLSQVVLRALAPERDARFQSAQEMRDALAAVVSAVPASASCAKGSSLTQAAPAKTQVVLAPIAGSLLEHVATLRRLTPRYLRNIPRPWMWALATCFALLVLAFSWLREARPGLASAEQSGSTLVIGAPIQSSAPVPVTAPLNVAASDEAKAAPVEPEPSKRSEMRKRTRRTKRTPAPREP